MGLLLGMFYGGGLFLLWLYLQGDSSGFIIPEKLEIKNLNNIWFG
jgi:hypothetical protein